MLALAEYEASLCGGCGGQLDETTDEAHDWTADVPTRCFKCTALGRMQDQYRQVNTVTGKPLTPQAQALKFKVYRER
jgi:uncharacterized protein with PIN domain